MPVTGSCTRCGSCCKPPIMECPWMLDEKKEKCRYLQGPDAEGLYLCAISNDKVRSGTPVIAVPEAHLRYWQEECRTFPDPDKFKKISLPSKCTFSFKGV